MSNLAAPLCESAVYRDVAGATHALAGGLACVICWRGPQKETANEDGVALIPCGEHAAVLAVADGFGGHPAGDEASHLALETLGERVRRAAEQGQDARLGILDGFEQANQAIVAMGRGAASTLAVLEVDFDHVRPYHVGDSAVLVFGQRGRMRLQTLAHSPVGYGVEAGLLAEQDALLHEDRHLVSNMLGTAEMRIDVGPRLRLGSRDTALIASDGLFDNLSIEEIVQRLRCGPLLDGVLAMAETCRQRMLTPVDGRPSKPDDLTVVAFRLAPPRARSGRPAAEPASLV